MELGRDKAGSALHPLTVRRLRGEQLRNIFLKNLENVEEYDRPLVGLQLPKDRDLRIQWLKLQHG